MIRLAIVLLIASAYFSPAHAAGVDLSTKLERGILDRVERDAGRQNLAAPLPVPDFTAAPGERMAAAAVEVPLPSSIWLFLAALAAGLLLIRRRADRA